MGVQAQLEFTTVRAQLEFTIQRAQLKLYNGLAQLELTKYYWASSTAGAPGSSRILKRSSVTQQSLAGYNFQDRLTPWHRSLGRLCLPPPLFWWSHLWVYKPAVLTLYITCWQINNLLLALAQNCNTLNQALDRSDIQCAPFSINSVIELHRYCHSMEAEGLQH